MSTSARSQTSALVGTVRVVAPRSSSSTSRQPCTPVSRGVSPWVLPGYAAGGSIRTDPKDPKGTKSAERFFEIRIIPEEGSPLRSGQRVIVRVEMAPKPLIVQGYRALLQLVQKRFQI